jgi:hypothetical protein
MDSKKQPLWLAMKSNCEYVEDEEPLNDLPHAKEHDEAIPIDDTTKGAESKNTIQIMFKNGDDIR